MAGDDRCPDYRGDDAENQRDERQHDAGQQLGCDHAPPPGHQGEGHHPRALRPLRGDEQDPDDRQQHAGRRHGDRQHLAQRLVLRMAEQAVDRDHGHSEQDDRQLQPEACAGVGHLAQLDCGQAGHPGALI
jgi:hypothetical protein